MTCHGKSPFREKTVMRCIEIWKISNHNAKWRKRTVLKKPESQTMDPHSGLPFAPSPTNPTSSPSFAVCYTPYRTQFVKWQHKNLWELINLSGEINKMYCVFVSSRHHKRVNLNVFSVDVAHKGFFHTYICIIHIWAICYMLYGIGVLCAVLYRI